MVKHQRYLDELYSNELVFILNFVSSQQWRRNYRAVYHTAHKVYLWFKIQDSLFKIQDSVWFNQLLPETLITWRKHLYRTLFSSLDFLFLTHDEFYDAFQGKKFRFKTCFLIPKVNYRTVYPEKLFPWPAVCLLAFEKVASFFIRKEC